MGPIVYTNHISVIQNTSEFVFKISQTRPCVGEDGKVTISIEHALDLVMTPDMFKSLVGIVNEQLKAFENIQAKKK